MVEGRTTKITNKPYGHHGAFSLLSESRKRVYVEYQKNALTAILRRFSG